MITSYHNSDSESNDEQEKESLKKPAPPPKPVTVTAKHIPKKQKTKPIEFGPSLPVNQSYSTPIGPELPPGVSVEKPDLPEVKLKEGIKDQVC